jgi:hypothetical protein
VKHCLVRSPTDFDTLVYQSEDELATPQSQFIFCKLSFGLHRPPNMVRRRDVEASIST